jgi:hypothetical protein
MEEGIVHANKLGWPDMAIMTTRLTSIIPICMFAVFVGYSPIPCYSQSDKAHVDDQDVTMVTLKIDLQDGFMNDEVNIRINGAEVFHKKDVRTRFQIGYAESFEVTAEQGSIKFEVILPSKSLSESVVFEISNDMYIGVSVIKNTIHIRASEIAFGYL